MITRKQITEIAEALKKGTVRPETEKWKRYIMSQHLLDCARDYDSFDNGEEILEELINIFNNI